MKQHNKTNKVALITGGSGGIGKAIAIKLAQNGYNVYATTRDVESDTIVELKRISKLEKIEITPIYLDLAKPNSIKQCIQKIIEDTGRIDVLVNNAASGYFSAIEDIEKEKFLSQIETNVVGVIQVIQQVLPHMRAQKSGKIFNISSILGFSTAPLNAPYSASKYAIESISETLALEVKPFGIDVIIMQPGDFHSDFVKNAIKPKFTSESPYYKLYKRQEDKTAIATAKRSPEVFAEKVAEICESNNPKLRYMVGKEVIIKKVLHTFLIDKLWIKFLSFFYKW